MEQIAAHFKAIGGLEKKVKPSGDYQKEIDLIETYFEKKVEPLLWEVLKEFQGTYFTEIVGFEVNQSIPILGEDSFLDFGQFFNFNAILGTSQSNEDLFQKGFLPFAEATPGDFIALSLIDGSIYFISHDFGDDEESHFKIAESLKIYLTQLKMNNEDNEEIKHDVSKNPSNLF